ncbi:zinc finger MYM-type protein 4-like [Nematolebias whitei]|uniref:zinc finger MYM-type protein 4-like n=1 Tax=Nematolebias whitei TaxID=451745 RepID=UPI00189925DD|nr:zinc finger MYM-type protein 4-like [Nematolebias whitei]
MSVSVFVLQAAEGRQLCPTCHTPHQLSDMLEQPDDEGALDFFCSHRCTKVHKAQTLPVPVKTSPSADEDDVKEVKPLLLSLPHIKEEPIDEFTQDRSESVSSWDIKQEPDEPKDLRIGSVFSLTEDSKLSPVDPPGSCSTCQRVLEDGATVYQRKAHTDLFCSTSCLLKFYQKKPVKTTCHFCLRVITNPQDVLRAAAGTAGTKDFCSRTCLSYFNYQRIVSTKLPLVPVASHSQCSACSRHCISKHEVILQGVVRKLCSDPCFYRFCTINKLSVCENCGSACSKPLCLKTEGGDKPLCGAECLARFKKTNRAEQTCAMCRSPQLMSDMVEHRNSDDIVELFCSKSCVMASKIQSICTSGVSLDCDNCRKTTVPVCHLAMSDASIRNFCSLTCAMEFKETQANPTAQTQNGSDKPPELLCAQCLQAITSIPEVIQNEKRLIYVCSSACSQDFKRINSIVASCEHCGSIKLINEVKRIGTKNCCFCSTGCSALFILNQKTTFSSCSFCRSVWRSTAQDGGAEEEFCSESCRSRHDLLLSSSPPEAAGAVHASPVLTNVVSLSSTLRNHLNSLRSSSQLGLGLFSDIQTKVVGHASVQTEPKQLKNKSMLCVPLVHNKGVSCSVQTSEAAAQTVPVYVPLPLNMYSQYTPVPVALSVPLPVPVFLSEKPSCAEPAEEEKEEEEEEKTLKSPEEEAEEDDGGEGNVSEEDGGETKEEETQRSLALIDNISSYRDEFETDLKNQKNFGFDSILELFFDSQPRKVSPKGSNPNVPEERLPDLPPPPAPPASPALPAPPAQVVQNHRTSSSPPPPSQQTVQGDQDKAGLTHREKLQRSTEVAEEEASAEGSPQTVPRRRKELSSERGVNAWRSWIEWRGSQSHLGHISSPAVTLKADLLACSSADLDVGLCLFIREVAQQRGRPVSPDHIFYLCLCIQQCLFENGRLENVFSDLSYQKFSSEMTKILRPFRRSLSAAGSARSCVKEEFLWGCKQLGAYSPIVLLNTLLFFFCKHFGFTTIEQHRQLSFTSVVRYSRTNEDGTKTNTLRFYPPTPSDHKQPDSDGVPAKKRKLNILKLKENKKNPLRCPVRFYEFYLSKCSESARRRSDLFYLQPGHHCLPSSPLWFSMTPLDDATLEAMIVRTLAVRLQQQK